MNRDGGHYFLTVLTPIHSDPCRRADGSVTAPVAALREALATLPTAAQSEACVESGNKSPFSRCKRTHLARFVVIDQPAFNGRVPVDTLIDAVKKTDLLVPQPVDSLSRSWLLLAADVDPGALTDPGADEGLTTYLTGLWQVMSAELIDIYQHCYRFTQDVHDADSFARYIKRCQVETTMPFNDYWSVPPDLPTLPLAAMAIVAGVFIAASGWLGRHIGHLPGLIIGLVLALVIAVYAACKFVMMRGEKPYPTAPAADLKSVLKALYVQQHFAHFAIDQQGAAPDALYAAFGQFVATHCPSDIAQPTQAPGVIHS